jgi:ABC-type branched-subunit amino acid transport system substrate-binding protein
MTFDISRRGFVQGSLAAAASTVAGTSLIPGLARAADAVKIGMLIPLSGPAGLFGPSCRNCAELATEEINGRGGLAGRPIQLAIADVGVPPAQAAQSVLKLWKGDKAEAFVGMHDSAVRGALVALFKGQVPYVYTPVYEGGECSTGTYVLGETPQQQVEPSVPYIAQEHSAKRWYLIGNDYNWPRETNAAAKRYIGEAGGQVVGEEYLPFTVDNFDSSLARIRDAHADAVLITLVGGASVGFNRAFASFGLSDKVVRLGTLIEENTLAGIGAGNSKNLYSCSAYFRGLKTAQAAGLERRYAAKFGESAPVLNDLAESCYEGMLLLETMAKNTGGLDVAKIEAVAEGLRYDGPRGRTTLRNRHTTRDLFLARANGATFEIVKTFPQVKSGQTCKV